MPVPARRVAGLLVVLALLLTACSEPGRSGYDAAATGACDGKLGSARALTAWTRAGSQAEQAVMDRQVATFNASQSQVRVELTHIPERDYAARVASAAAAGKLPDVLDLPASLIPFYAWQGRLKPLYNCLSDDLKANLDARMITQGSWQGRLYGAGGWEPGLAMYARGSALKAAGLRVPKGPEDAWTSEELAAALPKLASAGYAAPLQIETGTDRADWATTVFGPVVWSAGGDLVDRRELRTAEGVLDTKAVAGALGTLGGWYGKGLVTGDASSFANGRSALAVAGSDRYAAFASAFADLQVLPLPDWGNGTRTSLGAWQWTVPSTTGDGDAAWLLVNFLLADDQVVELTHTNGGIPATRSALDRSPQLAPRQPQQAFVRQLRDPEVALARPSTPAYPVISGAFAQVVTAVTSGKDVQAPLKRAAAEIDADIAAHDGYAAKR